MTDRGAWAEWGDNKTWYLDPDGGQGLGVVTRTMTRCVIDENKGDR